MADAQAAEGQSETGGKKRMMPLLIGVVLAAVLGGAGFYATYSGMLDGGQASEEATGHEVEPVDVAFIPIEPILVSVSGEGAPRHLRFRANVEVEPGEVAAVEALMPRILDVLNGYLRAVETAEIERPTALIRIRAQMLRRIQLVVGGDRVRDLLISEFVLN